MKVKILFVTLIIVIIISMIFILKFENDKYIKYKNKIFNSSFIETYIAIKSYESSLQYSENRILNFNDVKDDLMELIIKVELAEEKKIFLDNEKINSIKTIVDKQFNSSLSGFIKYCNFNNIKIKKEEAINYYKYISLSELLYNSDENNVENTITKAIEVTKIIINFGDSKDKAFIKANNVVNELKENKPLLEVVSNYGIAGTPIVYTNKNINEELKYLLDEKTGYISDIIDDNIENAFIIYRINESSNENLIKRIEDIGKENNYKDKLSEYIKLEKKNIVIIGYK